MVLSVVIKTMASYPTILFTLDVSRLWYHTTNNFPRSTKLLMTSEMEYCTVWYGSDWYGTIPYSSNTVFIIHRQWQNQG